MLIKRIRTWFFGIYSPPDDIIHTFSIWKYFLFIFFFSNIEKINRFDLTRVEKSHTEVHQLIQEIDRLDIFVLLL